MNLKEAYRYSNFLDTLFTNAQFYMSSDFFTKKEQWHLRSRADKEAADETVLTVDFSVDFSPMDVIDFSVKIIAEKERLMNAISAAKAKAEINIDNAIAMNKIKQQLAKNFDALSRIKGSTKTSQGVGFRFNVNNEQVRYLYDIEEVTTINFDRCNVRNLSKKYLKETDEISARLDTIQINTTVDFVPQWDVNDHFEDLITPNVSIYTH